MGCFSAYSHLIMAQADDDYAGHLDAAAALAGCVRRQIMGSGPLYHGIESAAHFTRSEKVEAEDLAKRTRELFQGHSSPDAAAALAGLADTAHEFAIRCLVARGAIHKGPPKAPA